MVLGIRRWQHIHLAKPSIYLHSSRNVLDKIQGIEWNRNRIEKRNQPDNHCRGITPGTGSRFPCNSRISPDQATIHCSDQSGNTPTAWLWQFGDGATSIAQYPTHAYAVAGLYTVNLTATNSVGTKTISKTNYLTITSPLPPAAAFSASSTSSYVGGTITFTDQSLYLLPHGCIISEMEQPQRSRILRTATPPQERTPLLTQKVVRV